MANAGGATIRLRRLWERPEEVPVAVGHGGHGGGDERMLTALYGPADSGDDAQPSPAPGPGPDLVRGLVPGGAGDAARQSASERDGALALVVGAAANECFRTGRPVRTADLVPGLGDDGHRRRPADGPDTENRGPLKKNHDQPEHTRGFSFGVSVSLVRTAACWRQWRSLLLSASGAWKCEDIPWSDHDHENLVQQ
jgi:hypothetical protein